MFEGASPAIKGGLEYEPCCPYDGRIEPEDPAPEACACGCGDQTLAEGVDTGVEKLEEFRWANRFAFTL